MVANIKIRKKTGQLKCTNFVTPEKLGEVNGQMMTERQIIQRIIQECVTTKSKTEVPYATTQRPKNNQQEPLLQLKHDITNYNGLKNHLHKCN